MLSILYLITSQMQQTILIRCFCLSQGEDPHFFKDATDKVADL